MKIAVSAAAARPEAAVDGHFGRCAYFVIYDTAAQSWQAMANPASGAGGGAGVQAAQAVVDQGVNVVVTGSLGPNAYKVLQAAGIRCFTGARGTVKEAVAAYEKGALKEVRDEPAPRPGMGMGRGRQMGLRKGGE